MIIPIRHWYQRYQLGLNKAQTLFNKFVGADAPFLIPKFRSKDYANPIQGFVDCIASEFGDNPKRPGLKETPDRVNRMYHELLNGYRIDPNTVFKTFDSNGYKGLVTAVNIDFYSLCEHHIIPFFGKVHIGYIPNGKILGLSKFARLVEIYSHRLQTQENLTKQIADALEKYLHPRGYIVYAEAEHLCVSMRGIKKKGFITKTTISKGLLVKNIKYIKQFYQDINI
jgi:GTP cyclohydrolase I